MGSPQRCAWAESGPPMSAYHDEEWGEPVRNSRALWEKLVLDGVERLLGDGRAVPAKTELSERPSCSLCVRSRHKEQLGGTVSYVRGSGAVRRPRHHS